MNEIVIDAGEFKSALKRALVCTSTDEDRPVLNCVHIAYTSGLLTVEAVDGFRLCRVRIPLISQEDSPWQVLIKRDDLKDYLKKKGKNQTVTLRYWKDGTRTYTVRVESPSHYRSTVKYTESVIKCPNCGIEIQTAPESSLSYVGQDGRYPDINGVIPPETDSKINTVLPAELKDAAAAINKMARVFNCGFVTRWYMDAGVHTLITTSEEHGMSRRDVEGDYNMPAFALGINAQFLADMLTACQDISLTAHFRTHNSPIRFDAPSLVWVIMPLALDRDAGFGVKAPPVIIPEAQRSPVYGHYPAPDGKFIPPSYDAESINPDKARLPQATPEPGAVETVIESLEPYTDVFTDSRGKEHKTPVVIIHLAKKES